MKKNWKGITLVVIVVIIVGLLILAGITMLFSENGIIKKDQDAADATKNAQDDTVNGLANLADQKNDALGIKTPIDKETSYVGYYADIEGDGTVDGVIYADLAVGGSGQWYNSSGDYSYTEITGTKDYYISQKDYSAPDAKFGTKDVIAPVLGSSGEDRFYVMALKDFTYTPEGGTEQKYFCWYDAACDGSGMTDYADTTKTGFGEGKTNTSKMITKWNASGYGTQNADRSHKDIWGEIQAEVNKGWFVPSRAEWVAFADVFSVTSSNYENFALSDSYWSSSQNSTSSSWFANFYGDYMDYYSVKNLNYVRLSATF